MMRWTRPLLAGLLTGLCLFLVPGCGAAGAAGPGTAVAVIADAVVYTNELPGGHVGEPYGPAVLEASLDGHAARWSVVGGTLPPGIFLTDQGVLEGAPEAAGVWSFTTRVESGASASERTLAIAVDQFGLFVQDGLVAGEAWAGRVVTLRAAGGVAPYVFSLAYEEDGILLPDLAGDGRLELVPATPKGDVADVQVLVEDATGAQANVRIPVCPDPTAAFVSSFGSTDVWYLDMGARTSGHAYATDLDAALAQLGLRDPDHTSGKSSEADVLAATYVRVQIHRELARLFHLDGSGDAPAVSFPYDRPESVFQTPVAGGTLAGRPHRYSALRLEWTSGRGVLGTSLVDDATNAVHEGNATAGKETLGVFLAEIAREVETRFGLTLLQDQPVDAADVPALRALLHGLPSAGGRTSTLRYAAESFARTVAVICAHEVGHGLGLPHTTPPVAGSLMNAKVPLGPMVMAAFTEADLERLRSVALPGIGRVDVTAATVSDGPAAVCVCGHAH